MTTPAVPAGPATPEASTGPLGEPAISVRGLRKRYGRLVVLDGLDLEVRRGELFALLGPNGAGKTTTVEILEGYLGADEGEVRVLGLEPVRDAAALRPRLAALTPTSALADALRIGLGAMTGDATGPLALLGAWGIGAAVAAARWFRWE